MDKTVTSLILAAATSFPLVNIAKVHNHILPTKGNASHISEDYSLKSKFSLLNTITIALSDTLTRLRNNDYDLFQFQVEFLLSPKCHGTVSENGELASRDTADNCLWDDSLLGKKTAKPDIYAILREGDQPLPKRSDCKNTKSVHCILSCPENQYRCQFTLLLDSKKTYSLFLADKDLVVDDTAGIFVFFPLKDAVGVTYNDKDGRSVVRLSSVNLDTLDACFSAIETLTNNPANTQNIENLKKAKDFLDDLVNYLMKTQPLPDFNTIAFIGAQCKIYNDQVKPQTY